MAEPHVSLDALKAMAKLSGLALTDEQLEELLPQVRQTVEGMEGLEVLNLEDVEPALIFKAEAE